MGLEPTGDLDDGFLAVEQIYAIPIVFASLTRSASAVAPP